MLVDYEAVLHGITEADSNGIAEGKKIGSKK
jgi:hypothetical protein